MGAIEIGTLVAVVGCFVGLAGWITGRDKRIMNDGEWKGSVKQDLKDIKEGVSGIGERMAKVEDKLADHETRLTVVEKLAGKEHTE